MKRIMAIALAMGVIIGTGSIASAADVQVATPGPVQVAVPTPVAPVRTPKINARQKEQQERILQGIRSDELTRAEARRLEAGEGRIQADKLLAKSDGNISPAERAKLNHELNHESKVIYRLKHNGRTAK